MLLFVVVGLMFGFGEDVLWCIVLVVLGVVMFVMVWVYWCFM